MNVFEGALTATGTVAQTVDLRTGPSSSTNQFLRDWATWFSVVVVLLVLALAGLKLARRLTLQSRSDDAHLWDLDKLRALRDSGELTIQEYETLRRAAIERMTGSKPVSTASAPTPPPESPSRP